MVVDQLLGARWAALQRAEARLAAGSYGRLVRSGQPIPDDRLEADPLAELSVEEEAAAERGAPEEGDSVVGLVSASHPFRVLADADITQRKRGPLRRTTTSLPRSQAWASTRSGTIKTAGRLAPEARVMPWPRGGAIVSVPADAHPPACGDPRGT
jgi:hypothetical protein